MSADNGISAPRISLDGALKRWLEKVAHRWGESDLAKTAEILSWAWGEIAGRVRPYPKLGEELRRRRPEMDVVAGLLHDCWALMSRYPAIRLHNFLAKKRAGAAILRLVRSLPESDKGAADRIDEFVELAVDIAYVNGEGGSDFAGAALLASVLLTSLEPGRFVDFRRQRWVNFAKTLNYHYQFPNADSYGEWLVQAGRFAQAVCGTKTFKRYWPHQEPLWTLAGLCWMGNSPGKPPKTDTPPKFPDADGVPEGKKKQKLHYIYERNRTVVELAKQYAWQRDRTLPCEVCGFSFVKAYGELGEECIEAHHKTPVATLSPGQLVKVEDIALVCANCHRMLHSGEKTLSIEELKKQLRN